MTVLYIEDDFHSRRLVSRILGAHQIPFVGVSDGVTGLATLETEPISLVLLDMGLPGMGGMEVAARIKTCPHLSHIPVIALTGAAMPGDRDLFIAAGCDDYMTKPISLQVLLLKINQYRRARLQEAI